MLLETYFEYNIDRVKVKGWKKIQHANTNQKKTNGYVNNHLRANIMPEIRKNSNILIKESICQF